MILIGNEILTLTNGHNSVTNFRKITGSNHNLGLVKNDAYIKFCKIQSICSQDIERKHNSDINQGPLLCYEFAKNDRQQSQPGSCKLSMHIENMVNFRPFVLKILSGNEILK